MPKKILFIDDDPDHLLICKLILERRNYFVLALPGCDPLDKFLHEVRAFQPDLIFIDQNMPGICGEAVIRILKGGPEFSKINIVFFSSHIDLPDLAKKAGADDFLKKPFEIGHLIAMATKYSELK